jgi:hypothetical protein
MFLIASLRPPPEPDRVATFVAITWASCPMGPCPPIESLHGQRRSLPKAEVRARVGIGIGRLAER